MSSPASCVWSLVLPPEIRYRFALSERGHKPPAASHESPVWAEAAVDSSLKQTFRRELSPALLVRAYRLLRMAFSA